MLVVVPAPEHIQEDLLNLVLLTDTPDEKGTHGVLVMAKDHPITQEAKGLELHGWWARLDESDRQANKPAFCDGPGVFDRVAGEIPEQKEYLFFDILLWIQKYAR